jgi:hypothetical protein
MKHGVLLLLLGGSFFYLAIERGGLHFLWIWPGLSFLAVACAYFGLGPRIFGKRSDGTLASFALVALLPYFLFTWGTWHLARLLIKEDCYNRVAPGLYLGRRPLAHELPTDIDAVVDLTAEFPSRMAFAKAMTTSVFPLWMLPCSSTGSSSSS